MRRDLEKDVVGRRIKEAEVKPSKNAMRVIRRHPKRKDFTTRLEGHKITKVERRGKYLVMPLDSGDVLVTHFGMSGQFQRGTGRVAMPAHTHVVLTFQQGGDLRYIDPRTFGEMFVAEYDEIDQQVEELAHLESLKPRTFVREMQNGGVRYVYADPDTCRCLYAGSEQQYQTYQKLRVEKEISEEQANAVRWTFWDSWPWP